ncbi:class I SAM-dependent methyltransferase [Ruminococcus sp.]|uniref:class I SAM-dependent DNA methyltransferase n=1 Tax=Ruminococcus sp. TaxID=41978 RepID=UPI0025DBA1C7|nr:class I SAM-dependent methyltransferase [Ruminococcus sp.]MBQ8966597.1 class I SAM-dependent methyltransferase [Ruminococcus sp.]
MNGYGSFAKYYDALQADVPYKAIAGRIRELGLAHSSENEVVVELGCGTGRLCRELEKLGFDVIGVDISEEMLDEAENARTADSDITYILQDMTELDLWGAADIIVCVLDGMNHLPNIEAFRRAVERASMFTCDGGLFIFDVNTEYKHRRVLGENSFVYDLDGLFCAWRNHCREDGRVDMALDFFAENEDGSYARESEYISEILISPEVIEQTVKACGFELIDVFDGLTEDPPCDTTQRELYVCRRKERASED